MGVASLGLVSVLRHLHKYTNTHWIVQFKVVSSVVCEVYLNKKGNSPWRPAFHGDQISSNLPTISGRPFSQASV